MSAPAAPTIDRVSAAFARETDARYAIGILERCGVEPSEIDLDRVEDGRGGVQLVILHVGIMGVGRDRILAAISGGHGVPMPEQTSSAHRSRVA